MARKSVGKGKARSLFRKAVKQSGASRAKATTMRTGRRGGLRQ